MAYEPDTWSLGDRTFTSRFILGSGKFNLDLVEAAVRDAGAEIVTLAVRRANTGQDGSILDAIPEGVTLLPNTSGARTADEAVRIARLARAMGCGDFVKVEVIRDAAYLMPDNAETVRATAQLAEEGFVVLPYMFPDLVCARDLVRAGAAAVMPLAAPIGSNKGLAARDFIKIIVDEVDVPVIVDAGIVAELDAIAATGLEEILLLTGEDRARTDPFYIGEACKLAAERFRMVGVEVYPMNEDEYAYLHECGVDYVTVFQETYDPALYGKLHLAGRKRVFPYRANAQERAMRGGMRGAAFGALLGLGDFRRDAFACGLHAWLVQRAYPHAELSLSCPRLRPIAGNGSLGPRGVGERQLLQVMCAYRLLLPQAGITISSRERAGFRDQVMGIAATKISAGVSTGVGEHADGSTAGDDQFEIADGRDVAQVRAALRGVGLEPVMNDYVRL